jgi:hypothetical protein
MKKTLSLVVLGTIVLFACKKEDVKTTNTTDTKPKGDTVYTMNFDGIDDKIQFGEVLSGLTDFTYEVKFKSETEGSYKRIFGWQSYLFEIAISEGKIQLYHNSNWHTATPNNINDGKWHHLAVTGGENTPVIVCLDGMQIYSVASIGTNFTGIGSVADRTVGWGEGFKGSLDEVRIWAGVRTQAEIRNTANTELTGNEAGLELYYDFNQFSNDTLVYDRSGNNNHGEILNESGEGIKPQFSTAKSGTVTLVDLSTQ